MSALRTLAARISTDLDADLAVATRQAARIAANSGTWPAELSALAAYVELAASALADGDEATLRLCLSRALLVQVAVDEHEAATS